MKLTDEQWQALAYIARQKELLWCGVYERGGDPTISALEAAGLIEGVKTHIRAGRMSFSGGYRITPAGRNALDKERGE